MRLSIIPGDNIVAIDGRTLSVNLSNYPSLRGVHAIQWDGKKGHVEYKNIPYSPEYRFNTLLDSIAKYQDIIDAWKRTAEAEDAKPKPVLFDPRTTKEWKEIEDALQHAQDGSHHGRSSPQSGVRQEDGYTTVRGERVQPGGRQDRDTKKEETKRRI